MPHKISTQACPIDAHPMVSVICITYNHEKYIKDCLDGVLMQETSFPVEVIVHDDASKDDTPNILKRYALEYPGLFNMILQQENQFSRNIRPTPIAIAEAKGRYIAFCDGDDYWTNPEKLERQIRHLEARPDANLCFHRAKIQAMDGKAMDISVLPEFELEDAYTVEDLIQHNFLPTSSVMARRSAIESTPDWFKLMFMNDWPRWILACDNSLALAIDEVMAVYRVHKEGMWNRLSQVESIEHDIDFYSVLSIFSVPHIKQLAKQEKRNKIARLVEERNKYEYLSNQLARLKNHIVIGKILSFWKHYINNNILI